MDYDLAVGKLQHRLAVGVRDQRPHNLLGEVAGLLLRLTPVQGVRDRIEVTVPRLLIRAPTPRGQGGTNHDIELGCSLPGRRIDVDHHKPGRIAIGGVDQDWMQPAHFGYPLLFRAGPVGVPVRFADVGANAGSRFSA